MKVFAKTDIGKMRNMNQDSFYISGEGETIGLYVLADGMGGYAGGEIASNLAVDSVKNYIKNNLSSIQLDKKEEILALINDAMYYANTVVHKKATENSELVEMGTTLEVCLIYDNKIFIGHVGDSRIYRIRNEIMRKLTTDHSYVEKLVKDGTITKEESYTHPKKNMLTKAIGCDLYVEPDIMVKGFQKGDIIIICSDGLTNMVPEEEIYRVIKEDIKSANEVLISRSECKWWFR